MKYSKIMKSKDMQPRLLYPASLSFKMEVKIQSFPDKKKRSEGVHFHQTSSTRDAKEIALRKKQREEHRSKRENGSKYLSIIMLNVNGLNAPIKRQRVAGWMRKQDVHICCLQEAHLRTKDVHRLKMKEWKKLLHANGCGKQS